MIARDIFYDRRDKHCKSCEFWRGVCLKGHALQSPAGCPVRKFPPVDGADYLDDKPVPIPVVAAANCCGSSSEELKPLTYGEAFEQLQESIVRWKCAGKPLTPDAIYAARIGACKSCTEYRWFQCRLCKCVAFVKAKLATEQCPRQLWKQ